MLSFLNFGAKWTILLPAIGVAFVLLVGHPITEMPYGLQEPLELLANGIAVAVDTLPMMEVIFDIMIWGIQIKILLLTIEILKWVISLFTSN